MKPCLFFLQLSLVQAPFQALHGPKRVYFGAQHMGCKGIAYVLILKTGDAFPIGRYILPQRAGIGAGCDLSGGFFQSKEIQTILSL